MSAIYSSSEMQKWDKYTILNAPISSLDLMERAALMCAKQLLGNHNFDRIDIVCGKGNNGGDGLAIARILAECSKKVSLYICDYNENASAAFEANFKRLPSTISITKLSDSSTINFTGDLMLDAIFGTGLTRPIDGWLGQVVTQMNEAGIPLIAIDIPSGLYSTDNSENPLKNCVQAQGTLTFQQLKMAFLYADYAAFTGKVKVLDIGLLMDFKGKREATLVGRADCPLTSNSIFAHKGNKGYLSIIAGNSGMLGSAVIAAKAGFKTGSGYVGLISPKDLIIPLAIHLPEAIWLGDNSSHLSDKTNAIAIGPGIGMSKFALEMLTSALESKRPLILDADALNLISENTYLWKLLPKDAILTPHLAELKRLIGETKSPEECLQRQIQFSVKYAIFILQKGAFSKLTCPDGSVYINSTGNSSMASAGMGDALTGMIGSFLAQGYPPKKAAVNGMFYHGLAGDIAATKLGHHGLLTSDLINHISSALNSL